MLSSLHLPATDDVPNPLDVHRVSRGQTPRYTLSSHISHTAFVYITMTTYHSFRPPLQRIGLYSIPCKKGERVTRWILPAIYPRCPAPHAHPPPRDALTVSTPLRPHGPTGPSRKILPPSWTEGGERALPRRTDSKSKSGGYRVYPQFCQLGGAGG